MCVIYNTLLNNFLFHFGKEFIDFIIHCVEHTVKILTDIVICKS